VHEEGEENNEAVEAPKQENEEHSMWEESFSGNTDSKPRGPESIGVDIDFPLSHHLYGIPEHADNFALRNTAYV
jgi:alpha 1,3-glucosidase